MNLSTNSSERIVLGNLSNTNTNFFTAPNTKNQSNSFIVPSKKKIHVDTPFPNKTMPKVNLSGVDKNDPENSQYNTRLFDLNNEDTSPMVKKTPKEKIANNRPKVLEIKKPKLMMLSELPVFEDTLNKKRQLEIEDDDAMKIEEKFGDSYQIPDAMFIEDKKINRVIDNVSFADTFQTFNPELEKYSEEEKEEEVAGEMINFYAEFPIDLSFGDGDFFIQESKDNERAEQEEVFRFLEADLAEFKPSFIEDIFE